MSPTNSHTENILLIVIVQLIVIVASSRAFGMLFRRFGQPRVCGEIAAGLVLGPSLFGGMFPALFHRVFDPSVSQIFSILSQIGLILLMFLIGLDFDFDHLRYSAWNFKRWNSLPVHSRVPPRSFHALGPTP
jgi:Kef-type K+ transport system membrane component KefB